MLIRVTLCAPNHRGRFTQGDSSPFPCVNDQQCSGYPSIDGLAGFPNILPAQEREEKYSKEGRGQQDVPKEWISG